MTLFSDAYWVVPHELMAGPYPYHLRGRLQVLLEAGILCFVDLTDEADVPAGQRYVHHLPAGVRHLPLGYGDMTVPPREHMVRILDDLDSALSDGLPAYVHCLMGLGRTGTVLGCWMARHRMASGRGVMDRIDELRRDTTTTCYPSPVTDEQRELVLGWPAGR